MAWSISMTPEGWDNVRRNLHGWDKKRLVDALCDDRFEAVESKGGTFHATAAADKMREQLMHPLQSIDGLAEMCFDAVQSNNLCDNGGHKVWIDREGCHKVPVDLDDNAPEVE